MIKCFKKILIINISIIFAALTFFGTSVLAKESAKYNQYFSKQANLKIIVNDISGLNSEVEKIIEEYKVRVDRIDINNKSERSTYRFITSAKEFDKLINRLEKLGTIDEKKIETKNNIKTLESNEMDNEFLLKQKEYYIKELNTINKNKNSKKYQELWSVIRDLDNKIYSNEKRKMSLENEVENYVINFTVQEKNVQNLNKRDDLKGFINMPGIESFLYVVENPVDEISATRYFGGSLRYLFTRGKSFFTIGILKPLDRDKDIDSQANDIVTYSLGKDFYPRYLGQGRRTFFNPYSGAQIGGMVLTSNDDIDHIFTFEPHIGLELFKNKYVIFDVRVGYIFPLDEERIKTLRGLTQSFSFNVVF